MAPSMAAIECPDCRRKGFIEIDGGRVVCTACGSVHDDTNIVSEITFTEGAHGSSNVVGQFVPSTGAKIYRKGLPGYSRDSREITIENGRYIIQQIASALKLNNHHVDAAQRLFMLAVQHNFIQGRKTQNVVAGCLYIVCRREKTPHMLIDFSDVLQTNVYVLGHTFLKFCRKLNLQLPIIDPSLYIQRFAAKLEFEEKTNAVANTALRIVQRMKRDWMQVGRRPSGICGAALFIGARMHGFKRTQKEIIQVVRICDVTLRKRLGEFSQTPASQLTPSEFQTVNLVDVLTECDPPAYVSGLEREKVKEELLRLKRKRDAELLERQKRLVQTERDAAASLVAAAAARGDTSTADEVRESFNALNEEISVSSVGRHRESAAAVRREMASVLRDAGGGGGGGGGTAAAVGGTSIDSIDAPLSVADVVGLTVPEGDAATPTTTTTTTTTSATTTTTQAAVAAPAPVASGRVPLVGTTATSATHGVVPNTDGETATAGVARAAVAAEEEEDTFSDLDDADIDSYISTASEVAVKTEIWEDMNQDYIKAMELRRQEEAALIAAGKPLPKKRRKGRKSAQSSASAAEAAMNVLQKKVSSKINYSVLEGLFEQSAHPSDRAPSQQAITAGLIRSTPTFAVPTAVGGGGGGATKSTAASEEGAPASPTAAAATPSAGAVAAAATATAAVEG